MEERGLDGLSVNDLCARADLNRGTFYNHFHDKDDLLTTLEDEVIADLERIQEQMQGLTVMDLVRYRVRKQPLPFLVNLFDYLREQGDFLHAVTGSGGDIRFAPRLRDSVCANLIQSILHERYRTNPTPFVQYYVAFYASAYLGVIEHWIETGMQESSEEMALIFMRLFFIKPGESITL
ncbi:MAG TPA: TetR/AcrR family transcriptional regulator [Candidatus Aphodovivens avistercoris]|nr:TetR/AcrR family transcriptional regulator [Candidatus Aphodovivens avistercoris]